ncbi:CHAD domain-containing protein [Labilibaculum sp. K2S]|uniref:CHAD domain-containing protein n=1 Tax=Labilibaculum sp. K2S TaxID=3056386 RepID=UPI0025A4A324|nr:CHAD domain-containing protein [Labilibaculum sp. K2S]MDM8159735.1 CHAD domain-containing protein [Labilibaculum sp. K2S]
MQSKEENTSLSSFYRERFDSFLINLSEAKQIKEEDIHKLRVDIKYIRSLLLLIEEFDLDTDAGSKLLKQLKGIFNSAGKLRALQVSKSLLLNSNVDIPSEIMFVLDDGLDASVEKFRAKCSEFEILKFKKGVTSLCSSLNQVNIAELIIKVDSIIRDELEIVNKLFNSSQGEEYHHEIRKLLKVVKALQQLLLTLQDDEKRRQALDIVNSTETLLGNWHNYKVMDNFLIKLDRELTQPTVKRTLKNLKNQNNRLKQEVKNESDKYLRNYF